MSKVPFTKLALKAKQEVVSIEYNDNTIEVKQYLPVEEKIALIQRVMESSLNEQGFFNPVHVNTYAALEIFEAYTNITFTEKQKEDKPKLFDLINENGVLDLVIGNIPTKEYSYLLMDIHDMIKSYCDYNNSAIGVLSKVQQDYSDFNFNIDEIQKKIHDPEQLNFVKGVLTKLG